MVTSMRRRRQILRVICCSLLLMSVAWPALGQELKQASTALAAKIAESGRKRVAVVDFTDLQGNVTELGRYLAEELSGALVNDARGFRVIDRAHLKAILQEHKLAATGLIDPETARQLGKIAGVDTLVTGTITSAFGDTVRVMVKALDVSTAEIIGQSTVDIPKTEAIQRLLGQGIQGASTGGTGPNALEPPKPSGAVSVEANDLLFVIKTCKRSGETLTCEGSVTNKGRQRRDFGFGQPKFVDNVGNDYPSGQYPVFRTGTRQALLEPDLAYNFWVEQKDVDPSATAITVVLDYSVEPTFATQKVAFRKMAIK
jgi:TolB-like protein